MSKVYTGNGCYNLRVDGHLVAPLRYVECDEVGFLVIRDFLMDGSLAFELEADFHRIVMLPRLGGEWVLTQDEIEQYLGKVSGPMIAHPTETPPANPTPWHWDVHEVDQDGVYSPLFAWNGFTAAYAQNETDDWRAAIQADKDAAAQFEAQII